MAYQKTHWQDHAVERPRTFTSVTNEDGSRTDVPSPGEVLQQGTPMSATNFNKLEEALQHYSVAFDMLATITQAEMRDAQSRIATLEASVEELAAEAADASDPT